MQPPKTRSWPFSAIHFPNDLAGLPQEERDAAEGALWKLAEALDKNDVQKAMAGKSAEPTVKKLSFLFDSLGVEILESSARRPVMEPWSGAKARG